MKILLTGANGYIGKRLLTVLVEKGHHVICCVRDKKRFNFETNQSNIEIWEHDFLKPADKDNAPLEFDAAYFLIHSMSSTLSGFYELENKIAENFKNYIDETNARQVIYLSGITNQGKLSRHLSSRQNVEKVLQQSIVPLTTLKAGIIIGSGSSSFEIIRDLVEKLPVMIAPKWLNTQTQPIAIKNVIEYLFQVLFKEETYNGSFDIAGPDLLTYKEMLLKLAKVRNLKRLIITLPIMTPRLSSYWLYFVTSTSYKLAVNLVNSLKVNIIANDEPIKKLIQIDLIGYENAVKMAYARLENQYVLSSWKDSLVSSMQNKNLQKYLNVPSNGCFKDSRKILINYDEDKVLNNIWSIGGEKGWYYGNTLWKLRGFIDKLFGGVGLRRGRTNLKEINTGDVVDFWRVLIADKEDRRLLLYAEMKLPGEAWLEFKIRYKDKIPVLFQTATFRPHGLGGRLYWYILWPIHFMIFNGMIKQISTFDETKI